MSDRAQPSTNMDGWPGRDLPAGRVPAGSTGGELVQANTSQRRAPAHSPVGQYGHERLDQLVSYASPANAQYNPSVTRHPSQQSLFPLYPSERSGGYSTRRGPESWCYQHPREQQNQTPLAMGKSRRFESFPSDDIADKIAELECELVQIERERRKIQRDMYESDPYPGSGSVTSELSRRTYDVNYYGQTRYGDHYPPY